MKRIRIGTRDSILALWQAKWVKERLAELYPDTEIILVPMKTKGDEILDVPLAKIGDKGLFTKELEHGLLRREIDLVVHSLKDLPTVLPSGLEIAAYCEREEPRDVFLSRDGTPLQKLPPGAVIGTSSLRRKAQLFHFRPDLENLAPSHGTLIFLMGMEHLPLIAAKLMQHGKSSATPVGIIQWGTRPEQRTLVGRLDNIASLVKERGFTNPAIIIVGEVVSLREKLQWFENNRFLAPGLW